MLKYYLIYYLSTEVLCSYVFALLVWGQFSRFSQSNIPNSGCPDDLWLCFATKQEVAPASCVMCSKSKWYNLRLKQLTVLTEYLFTQALADASNVEQTSVFMYNTSYWMSGYFQNSKHLELK